MASVLYITAHPLDHNTSFSLAVGVAADRDQAPAIKAKAIEQALELAKSF